MYTVQTFVDGQMVWNYYVNRWFDQSCIQVNWWMTVEECCRMRLHAAVLTCCLSAIAATAVQRFVKRAVCAAACKRRRVRTCVVCHRSSLETSRIREARLCVCVCIRCAVSLLSHGTWTSLNLPFLCIEHLVDSSTGKGSTSVRHAITLPL